MRALPTALRLFLNLLAVALLLAAPRGQAQPLEELISDLLTRPAAQRAVWGVHAVWLDDGSPLYSHNEQKLFTPASTAKLYSTALALHTLGGDHRFETLVTAETPISAGGVLSGDLRLIGGGDPNLSARILPYDPKTEFGEDRMAPVRELAEQLYAAGLRRVEGDVVGDDRRYVWQPHPPGWSIEDAVWGYGAPVSALSFNDNAVEVLIRPGTAAGQPAQLRFEPDFEYLRVVNRTQTARTRRVAKWLDARRRSGEPASIDLWGQISIRSPGREMTFAVDDPALFAAAALRSELEALGVEIEGGLRADHLEPHEVADLKQGPAPEASPGIVLARRPSQPLGEILTVINKSSQNLHAEMLLREAGLATYRIGTLEAGIGALRDRLKEIGLSPWEFYLGDGSGLSRKSLVSPAGTVKLLRATASSANGDLFRGTLAVGGVDGTLDWRFSDGPLEGRLNAKTGTLSHVTALAGYATAADGRPFAFAVFVNNFGVSTSYIRNLVDRIVETMATSEPQSP